MEEAGVEKVGRREKWISSCDGEIEIRSVKSNLTTVMRLTAFLQMISFPTAAGEK